MHDKDKITKEYFFSLLDTIVKEAEKTFKVFPFEKKETRSKNNDNGQLQYCETVFAIKSKTKFINFWFTLSNTENKPYSVTISIGDNTDNDYGFNIKDYLSHNNINFDKSLFFRWLDNYEDSFDIAKKLISEILNLIQTKDFNTLLQTDFKPNIPIDYSPYK
jgi:hypothetical protein